MEDGAKITNDKFPKGFFFGASISSHQVEGYNYNNWTIWEKENAERLASEAEAKKGWVPIWDQVKDEASDPSNYISGNAADHFNKYDEDFSIAKELNLNALRFSIEWSRIEPVEGEINQEALQFYHKYIDSLKNKGLEPFMTIWHWTVPPWFEEKGGFEKKKNIKYFEKLVDLLAEEFSDKVTYWITLNEPRIYASESFLNGRWPPQKHSIFKYFFLMRNLRKAHKVSVKTLRNKNKNLKIGIAENIASYTSGYGLLNRLVRKLFAKYELWLANSFHKHSDFSGLNYYFHRHIENFKVSKIAENEERVSDLGWDLYPDGIHSPLVKLKECRRPIIITENGLADRNDTHREWFIKETFKGIQKAINEGVDIQGYLHWSLIDNFEWDSGFWPRFGLVEIDYKNDYKRKVRESALKYSEMIKEYIN